MSKVTLYSDSATDAEKRGTLFTLVSIMESLLRIQHPFMPFITEEIWQRFAVLLNIEADTIMCQAFPNAEVIPSDDNAMQELDWLKAFILGVRRIRAERNISPGKTLAVLVNGGNESEQHWLKSNQHYIQSLGRVDSITTTDSTPDDAVVALAGEMTLLVPLADLIDLDEEQTRLKKEINKLLNDKQGITGKLKNKNFTDRAPADVRTPLTYEEHKSDD